MNDVIKMLSIAYSIDANDIFKKRGKRDICDARLAYLAIAKDRLSRSEYSNIRFGSRKAYMYESQIRDMLSTNSSFRSIVSDISSGFVKTYEQYFNRAQKGGTYYRVSLNNRGTGGKVTERIDNHKVYEYMLIMRGCYFLKKEDAIFALKHKTNKI